MPALRVLRPSVPPITIVGITGTPGQTCFGYVLGGGENVRAKRGSESRRRIAKNLNSDLIVSNHFLQRGFYVIDGVFRQDAAVDVGGGELGKRVESVAAFEHGGDAGGAQRGVVRRRRSSDALHGVL